MYFYYVIILLNIILFCFFIFDETRAISFALSSPIMILGFVNETNILNNNQCVLSNYDFIICGTVSGFFIPLGIMGILFGITTKL